MSTSSNLPESRRQRPPIADFSYRDIAPPIASAEAAKPEQERPPGFAAHEVEDMLSRARAEASAAAEARLRSEYEARSTVEAEKIRHAIDQFRDERRDYFSQVESDVVRLALSIAAKILHRESQIDPMLVAALVRIAVEKLHDGSRVSLRIPPLDMEKWRAFFAHPLNGATVEIVADAHLGTGDCVLETELGSVHFSIEAQLKEVEQGFFDLLARRPAVQ
jgi:flagellar biosynthesis/type III secretory pathway protein FliH